MPNCKTLKRYILLSLALVLLPAQQASAEEESRIEFSGFARVVAGYLNDDNASFNEYSNSVNIRNDSLLGLRADLHVSDSISLVSQAILRASDRRDSEIQWLYLDYRPSNNLSFKLGRQRIPLFQYSEIIDVGFAYPWIALPREIYSPFFINDYDGILGSYEFSTRSLSGSVDAYYGIYDGDVSVSDRETNAKVTDLTGFATNLQIRQFNFRASFHRANVEVIFEDSLLFQQTLFQLGFFDSANVFTLDDSAEYFQFSSGWENLDYFARLELTGFDSAAYFVPKTENFYFTFGYNFDPYTVHFTIAQSNVDYGPAPNEIPLGIDPQLDFLALQLQAVTQNKPMDDIDSVTLGLRYDLQTNIALKADITFIKGQSNSSSSPGSILGPYSVDEDTELLQFAVEWVF